MRIVHKALGHQLFACDAKTIRDMVETAVRERYALYSADLSEIDLREADLRSGLFTNAIFWKSDLTRADLWGACLIGGNLRHCTLRGADLSVTDLTWTSFDGADLTGTVLDPAAEPNQRGEFREVDGECVGYRTRTSPFMGSAIYEDGEKYRAPVFSVCPAMPCHPGLYVCATVDEVRREHPTGEMIEVRFRRRDLHQAGPKDYIKHRVRAFRVVGAVERGDGDAAA